MRKFRAPQLSFRALRPYRRQIGIAAWLSILSVASLLLGVVWGVHLGHRSRDSAAPVSASATSPDVRVCSAFTMIDSMVQEARRSSTEPVPEVPQTSKKGTDPAPAVGERPGPDYIGLASALSNLDKENIDPRLGSAVDAYAQSLASLGAATNHHDSLEIVAELGNLSSSTGNVVKQQCAEHAALGN